MGPSPRPRGVGALGGPLAARVIADAATLLEVAAKALGKEQRAPTG
jgi:hypothetical protein